MNNLNLKRNVQANYIIKQLKWSEVFASRIQ